MGNDTSLPEPSAHGQPLSIANGEVPTFGDRSKMGEALPPMVLIVESALWSSPKATHTDQMFYIALLDGCEVGRAASYPSPSVRVAPCTTTSIVTLKFFAGSDLDGFIMHRNVDLRELGEVLMPLGTIVQYGAPLYTSMWLGLPDDEAAPGTTLTLAQALVTARSPAVPKVRVTFFKPALNFVMSARYHHHAPEHAPPPVPQPDIKALCANVDRDDGGWDACLGPSTPAQCEISTEQQVRGLVEALKIANETACVWQRAIFCPTDSMEKARYARGGAALDDLSPRLGDACVSKSRLPQFPPTAEEKDDRLSVASNGRQELERQLDSARVELERLRGVEEQQQGLQKQLTRALSDLKMIQTTDSKHQEELEQLLVQKSSENEQLRSFHNDALATSEDFRLALSKLERITQENARLKQEQAALVDEATHLRSSTLLPSEEYETLRANYQVLRDERDNLQHEGDESHEREAILIAQTERAQNSISMVTLQVESLRFEKENIMHREQQRQAQFNELARENEELQQQKATWASFEGVPMEVYRALQDSEQKVQKQLFNVSEERQHLRERLGSFSARLKDHEEEIKSPMLSQRPEVPSGVPVEEYEKVHLKCREFEQECELLRASSEKERERLQDLQQRLRELETQVEEAASEAATPRSPLPSLQEVHERPLARAPPGVPVEEYDAVQARLEATELKLQQVDQERQSYMQLAQENANASAASLAEHEILLQKLSLAEEKVSSAEEERQGYMELARAQARTREEPQDSAKLRMDAEDARRQMGLAALDRDNLQSQLAASYADIAFLRSEAEVRDQEVNVLRDEIQRTVASSPAVEDHPDETVAVAEAVADAINNTTEHFRERERVMTLDMESLQGQLSAVLRSLDEVKQQADTQRQEEKRQRQEDEKKKQVGEPASSSSALGKKASEGSLTRSASDYGEGEKTALGAKVSELRMGMKKQKEAHKEDMQKLSKEVLTCRAVANAERQQRLDMGRKLETLEQLATNNEERFRAEAMRVEQLSSGDQDARLELARIKGEVEVLRIREKQWQTIATGSSSAEVDGGSGSLEAPVRSAVESKMDGFILRLFQRLLWEKFSHFPPDDLHKALKMDQRPATIPKSEVDKVLKMYRSHYKGFTMAKAFRGLDVHRTGRLAAHEFELRLTQTLSLDVELSGHIYGLLNTLLHGDSTSGAPPDDMANASSAKGEPDSSRRTPPSSTRSLRTPPASSRLESSRSIEEGMINEEEFINFFESNKL